MVPFTNLSSFGGRSVGSVGCPVTCRNQTVGSRPGEALGAASRHASLAG
jgi:hypothetical protein